MYYVNPDIQKLYRTSYSESRSFFIRLDMNENPEGLPVQFFEEVMKSITPELVAMYPETKDLVEKLSINLQCKPTNICLTNGSDDAIRLLFEVFGERGKSVVSVSPSFEMYSVYMKMYGMVHSPVTFNEEFEINLEEVLNAIDRDTGIVVLLNPNSPIGKPWTEKEVEKIIAKADENDAIVVIDEAYFYFSSVSFLHLVSKHNNVMVFRTFSKLLSIAGARIGYIVSNNKIIEELKKASSTYPVNCFAIKFAEKMLETPKVIEFLIDTEVKGRQYLLSCLEQNHYKYHYNNGNYVLIKTNKKPEQIFTELKKNNILIKTYSKHILSDWIRITTGSVKTMQLFWKLFYEFDSN